MKMKILYILLFSHCLAAVIGGATLGIVAGASSVMFGVCLLGGITAVVGVSVLISRQLVAGLRILEQSVATAQGDQSIRIEELENTRTKLRHACLFVDTVGPRRSAARDRRPKDCQVWPIG